MGMQRKYDVLSIGRSSIDLYANEIGIPFTDVKTFAAYVGGCPTNVSVAAQRLNLQTALLTAVGEDYVGDFVLNFLRKEGVDIQFAKRKPESRTSAFLLAIEPPETFSIVPYRDNCSDLQLSIVDVLSSPIAQSRSIFITGSGLSHEPSRSATLLAAEKAHIHGTKVIFDLDYRPEMWPDKSGFSQAIQSGFPMADVVLGTTDEFEKAMPNTFTKGENWTASENGIDAVLAMGAEVVVVKRGAKSTLVYTSSGEKWAVPTFSVKVLNVLGAGDAFTGGFLYGYLKGWEIYRAVRMGNACGAIVVTRHGCANFMPYEEEVASFIEEQGGF